LRKRRKNDPILNSGTLDILLMRAASPVPYREWLGHQFAVYLLSLLLFLRKYVFIPMVLAVTASIMGTGSASSIILNGVAIFFVVDVDNLIFSFLHSKDQIEKLEEEGSVHLNFRENRYIRFLAVFSMAMLSFSLITIVMQQQAILKKFGVCSDPNGVFKAGGLFIIAFLFMSYFIAEIAVPLSERCFPNPAGNVPRKSASPDDWAAAASSEGKLELKAQAIAIGYIVFQGVLGGLFFWYIVKAFFYAVLGENMEKYTKLYGTDPYSLASYIQNVKDKLQATADYYSYYY